MPIESTSGNVYHAFDLLTMEPVVVKAFAAYARQVRWHLETTNLGMSLSTQRSIIQGWFPFRKSVS